MRRLRKGPGEKKIWFGCIVLACFMLSLFALDSPAQAYELKGWGPMKGVAQKPDGSPYRFAFIPWALRDDFMITLERVTQTLVKRAGGEVIVLNPDNNLQKQIAMFEDSVVKGIDGIIFHPVDSAGVVPAIERLSAKVPFFNIDHGANTDAVTTFSTHDQVDCGRVAARYLVDYAKKHKKKLVVYEVWGKTGHEGSERRHQGYHEIFSQYPDLIKVIESPGTGWMTDKAMQYVIEAMSVRPEINAVCTHNNMVPGVVEAFRNLGKLYPVGDPKHIPYVGIDCFPVAMQHLRAGYADGIAVHSPWEETDAAVKCALLKVACGLDVPKLVNFDSFLITLENVNAVRFGAPAVWGDMWNKFPNFDDWPILDLPEKYGVPIPTRAMKKPGY